MLKPDTSYAKTIQNITIAWPTKLALAPKLAREIMDAFDKAKLTPRVNDTSALQSWPKPSVSSPIWEQAFCKKEN